MSNRIRQPPALRAFKGRVLLEIIGCNDLPAIDGNSSDPYAKVVAAQGLDFSILVNDLPGDFRYMPDDGNGMMANCRFLIEPSHRTFAIDRCLNPQWNMPMELFAHNVVGDIRIEIWDHNAVMKDKIISACSLSIVALANGQYPMCAPFQVPMQRGDGAVRGAGTLTLTMAWVPELFAPASPLEEVAVYPKGSLQTKTFESRSSRIQINDVKAVNLALTAWMNKLGPHVELVKVDSGATPTTAYASVIFKVL